MTRSVVPLISPLAALLAAGCFDLAMPIQVDAGTIECDGGRYDQRTGLCWQAPKIEGQYGWQNAIDYCDALDLGGHGDWRLPEIDELLTLFDDCDVDLTTENGGMCDPCCDSETCSALFCSGHDGEWSSHWSSSPCPFCENCAWLVEFGSAQVAYADLSSSCDVRCVRGPADGDTDTETSTGSDSFDESVAGR
jgi:hypothetical protein